MKNKSIRVLLTAAIMSIVLAGCGSAGTGNAADTAPAAPAEAEETAETSDAGNDTGVAEADAGGKEAAEGAEGEEFGEDEEYEGPSDFLQEQSGIIDFASFDEAISNLKDGQGYATIKVYGYDGDILAVSDSVFLADHSAADASLYAMVDGKAHFLGVVTGNGSAFPLRLGSDGIIYCGDNHTYESDFMNNSGGIPGIMIKDYVYDGIDNGGEFGGFLREENTFDNDKDFTGGQKEFDAMIAEREKQPILEFTLVGNGGAEEAAAE